MAYQALCENGVFSKMFACLMQRRSSGAHSPYDISYIVL